MLNKIKNLKLNIRQHVLLVIFGCCLFTFLVMIAVSFHSFLDIRDAVRGEGDILGSVEKLEDVGSTWRCNGFCV